MLIILAIFLSTALANSHEKYIDLLSEEEKQEFLNKVARRILETVENTENVDKSSREITDSELKEHNKFVQDILKEESLHMRKRRADDIESEDSSNSSEHLQVKPLNPGRAVDDNESDKTDNSSDTEKTNPSVKSIKRRSNDETIRESASNNIKVEIVTENVLPMQKRFENTDNEGDEPDSGLHKQNSKEEDMVSHESKNLGTSDTMHTKETKYVETTKQFRDLRVEETNNASSTTFQNETDNKESKDDNNSGYENNSDADNESEAKTFKGKLQPKDNSNHILTTTAAGSEIQKTSDFREIENEFVKNSSSVEIAAVTVTNYLEDSSENPNVKNTLTSSLTDEATTTNKVFIEVSSYLTTTESPIPHKHSTLASKAYKSNKATKINNTDVSEHKTSKKVYRASPVTTTRSPVLTTTKINTKKPKKITKLKKHSENTTFITYLASNALKKSKSEYNLKNTEKAKPNTEKKYEDHSSLQPYQVYEIPWPLSEDKPFLRNPEPMEDQPYFIPVYKYSPNFAYYNPRNLRGPNPVEENSIEVDENLLREGSGKTKKSENPEFILQLNDELRKFGLYKRKTKRYTEESMIPTTPASLDDDSTEEGNTVMKLPDSDEALHPINSMKNGLKTHIKAIRDVLFKKHIYGDDPEKWKEYIHHVYGNTDILDKYPNHEQSDKQGSPPLRAHYARDRNIDTDYYFDRIKRLYDKTKDLNRLQGQNSPEMPEVNELLIMNSVAEKLNDEPKTENSNDDSNNLNTIAKILSVTDEKDVFVNLEKMEELNLKLMRRNEDVKVGIYMKVLKEWIEQDNKALKQYDWLATTVQIQSALEKLFLLIDRKRNYKPLHPADTQILKYAIFIHNFSLELKGANKLKSKLRKEVKLLPKKKNRRDKVIKEKGLSNRVWLYLRRLLPDLTENNGVHNLHEFLKDVEDSLYDFHEAITNIAKVTKFKHQNWFNNMKELYLTSDEKHLRELLLHISFSRLVDLIENSCENGLENDFIKYMKTHKKESKRTLEEALFVLNILDEIKSNLE